MMLPPNRGMFSQLDGNKLHFVVVWNIFVIKDSLNGVKQLMNSSGCILLSNSGMSTLML
jgi:hypothetical protein